jgi:2-oxoglutarate ferredoxin oxidoreductase subunit alpha
MTPATDILHVLEANQKKTGMVVHQPEDEIAAIHTALGGSFAGIRSACGTSGGGFALMNEGLSLTGMLELPLVIFEIMRPGPATGNPTWSDQGDLSYVLTAGHGDFPRAVIAPGSPEQVFDCVQHAFNIADKYQIPVIVISDKHLGESGFTISKEVFSEIDEKNHDLQLEANKDYKRYLNTQTGISPRTIPGIENGEYIANSDEHNEESFSDESSEVRKMQMEKRMKKIEELRKEIPLPRVYGPMSADISLVCWGSAFGACLDTINTLNSLNTLKKKVNLVHFEYLWPMPKNLDKFLSKFKKLVLVENNYSGQLGKLIRQETGIEIKDRILKYDSRPFWTDEILEELKKVK